MIIKHEDDRRILESFPEAKVITAKVDCEIGNHFHKIKTEMFILSSGECLLNGDVMEIGKIYVVPPGVNHSFKIAKDSVLVGINSHPYDGSDDYKK